jgi:hypothetical protein
LTVTVPAPAEPGDPRALDVEAHLAAARRADPSLPLLASGADGPGARGRPAPGSP